MKCEVRERSVLYDVDAAKRPVNVTVNADLLRRARQRWLRENRGAIDACNREVEERGCFADFLRCF